MKLDYLIGDYSLPNSELLKNVYKAIELKVDTISVYSSRIPWLIAQFERKSEFFTPVHALIDFPSGGSSPKTKLFACNESIKGGATGLDIVINSGISDNKTQLKQDLSECIAFALEKNVTIRAILNHQDLGVEACIKIGMTLKKTGIDTIILGTGTRNSDLLDDVIVAEQLSKKCAIMTIINTLNPLQHFDLTGLYGLQLNSISFIQSFRKFHL